MAILLPASIARADGDSDGPSVRLGGYIQPQFQYRQNDAKAPSDQDSFKLRRARLIATAEKQVDVVDLTATVEAELAPEFQLLDAYLTARAELESVKKLGITVDAGQVKAPFSRQDLLSDANLAFVDKAEIASLAPDRQIGARLGADLPVGPMFVRATGGMFDGEGRNQPQNINDAYLYAGRFEIGYGDRNRKLAESDLDDATYAIAGGSIAHNTIASGSGRDKQISFGYDLAVGTHGASAAFEYLEVRHFQLGTGNADFHANGFAVQANYILPIANVEGGQLEVGGRVEEIDRNDTIPIAQPGDPNQSLREYTGVLSYYQRGHSLKAQLTYTHVTEVEDVDSTGRDATFGNDTAILQVTYRME